MFGIPHEVSPTWPWQLVLLFIRALNFSGFVILLISSFLIGYQGIRPGKLLLILFGGCFLLGSISSLQGNRNEFLTWDIFPLLLVGLSFSFYLQKWPRILLILGQLLLLIQPPSWQSWLAPWLSETGQSILIGRCPGDYGDWPILPWLGLIAVGTSLGTLQRLHPHIAIYLRSWEFPFWTLSFGGLLKTWQNGYWHAPFGPSWSCYVFNRPWEVFLSSYMLTLLLIRCSLLAKVQLKLQQNSWVRWVSSLGVNQKFYSAYLAHFLLLLPAEGMLRRFSGHHTVWGQSLALLGVICGTFLLARWTVQLSKLLKSH